MFLLGEVLQKSSQKRRSEMRLLKLIQNVSLAAVAAGALAVTASAQDAAPTQTPTPVAVLETKPETAQTPKTETPKVETPRQESLSEEEAAIIPYYNNYLREYHLGPEDVISVEVFGQPNYSKAGIAVPPTATISYPLIPGGVFVAGKTTEQIAAEITKKLDEYIIDPKVTVTLEKVGSARYSVLGDVGQPGVRLMTRRLSVSEALLEAGGVLATGSRSKITILRQNGGGGVTPIPVNLAAINAGKAENVYLVPGDQLVVPGNKIKTLNNVLDVISKVSVVRLLFGSPF